MYSFINQVMFNPIPLRFRAKTMPQIKGKQQKLANWQLVNIIKIHRLFGISKFGCQPISNNNTAWL